MFSYFTKIGLTCFGDGYCAGRLEELLFSADMGLDLKVVNMKKKLSFRLSQLSILSRVLQDSIKHQNSRVQIPLRSSSTDPSVIQAALVPTDDIHSVANDASSSTSDSRIELSSEDSHQDSENYILRQLTCFIAAEEPVSRDSPDTSKSTQPWVGSGSISGFDVTISLSEIQVRIQLYIMLILKIIEPTS